MDLREFPLTETAVEHTATFGDAADELVRTHVDAIAVIDGERRVVGLFTNDDVVQGLFPRYLAELRHTAFLADQLEELKQRLVPVLQEPVSEHMRKPVVLDIETSASHAAEKFLHCEWGAVAVVDDGRFAGMLSEVEFARVMLERMRPEG